MKKSMIQRLGCLVASISFAFVGATAFAVTWFDGQISATPDLTAGSGGKWTVPTGWDSTTKTYNNFNESLKFEATESKSNIVSITTSVKFTAKDELLVSEIAGAKGGLAVLENEDSTATNYYGVVSGRWEMLSGVEPDLTKPVEVSISLFSVGKSATTYINYSIDGTALTYENKADILTTCAGDGSIKSVEYLGKCELASLSGATAAPYVAQGDDQKFYKTIAEAGEQAVTIVNATSYTPTATTIGSCNISDPDGFLELNQGTLANVGLKVATVNGQVVIRPNFTSNTGDGTSAAAAWEIGSEADLNALRLGVASKKFGQKDEFFKQKNSIALTDVWEGIGQYGKDNTGKLENFRAGAFQGTYDGGNYAITGLKLKSDFAQETATNKYIGFFFSTYKATIKNIKFGIANYGWDEGKKIKQDVGAGIVVGTSWNSTFEGIEILKGTDSGTGEFYGTHAISALVGFTTGTNSFANCTNNIDITENRNDSAKVAAFSACNQNNAPKLNFVNCVNKGSIRSTKGNFVAGFSAYNDGAAEFTNCSNEGSVTADNSGAIAQFVANNNGSAKNIGGCSGLTTPIAVNKSGTDFNFATIAGEPAVATFVKNADLAAGNTYKVMAPIAAPAENIVLAKDEWIAFDNSLCTTFKADGKIVADDPASAKITTIEDNPKIYAWASKIVPITPDPLDPIARDLPSIAVHDDVLKERGINPEDTTAVTNYLLSTQANGQKGWVNYALGIADDAGVDNTPVLVDESTEANKIQINLGIDYEIDENSGCSAKIVKEGGEKDGVQVSEAGVISLTDATETEVFTVKFVVTDNNGGKAETVVEKDVGIEKKTPANALEIISVPFTDLASDETVSIGNVLKAANLTVGDKVYVYDAIKGENVAWTLGETGAWTGEGSVSLKPGDGIWLERKNTSKPVFAFGGFQTADKSTTVAKGNWAVVANPNLAGEVNLNEAVIGDTGDQIVVETGAAPKTFTYENGAWGYNKTVESIRTVGTRSVTVKKVSRVTEESTIPAGAGFWFGNAGESAKTINWSVKGN